MVVVIAPKLTWEKSALGGPNWGRLKRLNASARRRSLKVSENETVFASATSSCEMAGARKALRPRLPNVPGAGMAKAAGVTQSWGGEPPGGARATPGP